MLERLKDALAECEIEKAIADEVSFEDEIRAELAEAEVAIRAKYDEKKAVGILDCEYEIRAIKRLIAKEEAKGA